MKLLSKSLGQARCLIALLSLLVLPSQANDFTVTVRENADGSATFQLSGSSAYTEGVSAGGFATNFAFDPSVPPTSLPGLIVSLPLPSGLQVEFTGGKGLVLVTLDIESFFSAGYGPWFLINNDSAEEEGFPEPEESSGLFVNGSGKVTVPNFPFFLLEPGTFVVESAVAPAGSPELGSASAPVTATGVYPFRTIYRVIPLERNPGITARPPKMLKSRRFGRPTKGEVLVENVGNLPLENLGVSLSSRDFRMGAPRRTRLEPGQSTTCKVTFSGRRSRASAIVRLKAKTPDRSFEFPDVATISSGSEVEEGSAEPLDSIVLPGESVSTRVRLKGVVSESNVSRPLSPRFPRGIYGPSRGNF